MSWEMKPISELCIFAIDCVNKTAPVVEYETPYKMIRTTNVKDGFIDLETVRYVDEETFLKWTRRSKPQYGDVIFTREAPVGSVGRFTSNDPNVFLGQRLFHYRPDPALLDWQYLTYILQSDAIQGWVNGIAFGATVPHIKVKDAEELKIPCPPIGTQRKIGAILSAYDDLIENNLKRIKLLEEMAQITYEEWFVRMKFPGHETAVFDEETGLPEGWAKIKLGELFSLTHGYAFKSEEFVSEETNTIAIRMGNFSTSGGLILNKNIKHLSSETKVNNRYILNADDLIMVLSDVTREGLLIGNVGFVPKSNKNYVLNQRVARLEVEDIYKNVLYAHLNSKIFKHHCLARANSATVLNLKNEDIYSNEISMPDEEVLSESNNFFGTINKEIQNLNSQIDLLTEARDILLPRLMTGMIDIEQVELPGAMLNRLEQQEDKMATAI